MTHQLWEEGLAKHAKAVAARVPNKRDSLILNDGPGNTSSSDDENGNNWEGYWK